MLGKVDSRYGLVLAGARRAREINEYTATLGLNDVPRHPWTPGPHPLPAPLEHRHRGVALQDKLEVGFRQPPEEAEEGEIGLPAPTISLSRRAR